MIRYLQERVNKRTLEYEEGVPAIMRETEDARAEAVELSKNQGKVHDLTRKLATKLSKENHAEDSR